VSFDEIMAELPKLTPEQRQLVMRRALELDDPAVSPAEEQPAKYLHNPSVALSLERIIGEVRQLPRGQAAELIDRLLIEAVAKPDSETDVAWRQEIRRRVAEIESGREEGVDGDEVMAELRRIIGR
jgi:putative addiction module component (TIGR02574 family)